MAFSKTPVTDTQQTVRVPSLGASFNTSPNTQLPTTLNFFNCFPEHYRQYQKDPIYRVVKRNALKENVYAVTAASAGPSIGKASLLASNVASSQYIFTEQGTDFVAINWTNGTPTAARIAAFNGQGTGNSIGTFAIDSSNTAKIVWLNQNADILVANASDGSGGVINTPVPNLQPAKGIEFLNGYLFAADDAGRIYNSTAGGVLGTWATTDFIVPEIYPDICLYVSKHKNHLVAFSQTSTEFFYDGAVEVGSPLVRQETYTSRVGFYEGHRPIKIDDDVYFIGKNDNQDLGIFRIRNFEVQKVSTSYVDKFLNWSSAYPASSSQDSLANFSYFRLIHLNNEPQVFLDFSIGGVDAQGLVYSPEQGVWWVANFTEISSFTGHFFFQDNWTSDNGATQSRRAWFLTESGAEIRIGMVDIEQTISVISRYDSEIQDGGVNLQRHIRYVDCIGDYGNNTVALVLYSDAKYTSATTTTAITRTGDDPYRFYNLGRRKRPAFGIVMTGTDVGYHEAFEITVNRGNW